MKKIKEGQATSGYEPKGEGEHVQVQVQVHEENVIWV